MKGGGGRRVARQGKVERGERETAGKDIRESAKEKGRKVKMGAQKKMREGVEREKI